MTATIYDVGDGNLIVKCNHHEFKEKWNCNGRLMIANNELFETMFDIASWANNELKTEMMFEVE